jgi:hypothetical protein
MMGERERRERASPPSSLSKVAYKRRPPDAGEMFMGWTTGARDEWSSLSFRRGHLGMWVAHGANLLC